MSRHYYDARRGGGGGSGFSITLADFERDDAVLKRRQQSPARSTVPTTRGGGGGAADDAPPPSIAMRARSKSKSRARAMSARSGMELIPLGTGHGTSNTNKASYYRQSGPHHAPLARQSSKASMSTAAARGRSRSVDSTANSSRYSHRGQSSRHPPSSSSNSHAPSSRRSTANAATSSSSTSARPAGSSSSRAAADSSRGRRTSPVVTRTRSKSATPTTEQRRSSTSRRCSPSRSASPPRSSRSHSRRTSSSRATGKRRERSGSTTRAREPSSSREDIDEQVTNAQREVDRRKRELRELQDEFDAMRSRIDKKRYEVEDLELVLDGLRKRQALAKRFRGGSSGEATHSRSRLRRARSSSSSSSASSRKSSRARSKSKARPSKRPCIVDEEDDDDDDDVVIIDVKQEHVDGRSRDGSGRASRRAEPTAVPIESPPRHPPTDTADSSSREMPDQFWGRAGEPKLLVEHRFKSIPDGSARKGRHLSVNPMKPSIFATSADEGGLILWSYNDPTKEISKVVTLTPSSFRHENSCAESIQWSPDGNRMAMAFRDPLDGMGEFCIVQLHQLKLRDSNTPQAIPKNRLTSKATTLHPKGISAIDWVPTGSGTQVTSNTLVTTGGSDHAVVLWEEHEDPAAGEVDFKWRVLHREHRSDIKALCIHSERSSIYTGGLDGLVVQYDVQKFQSQVVMERRKPTISRINAVLEHPHNPNLLLVSSLEQNEHNLLLRDLRERAHHGTAQAAMNMTWAGNSTSQYIVPRWSPAGMHVSCGSKSGIVNIWDVRMRGALFPKVLPQQSLRVHQKTVLHATWHPQHDAIFTVSFDRTIGLSTFR